MMRTFLGMIAITMLASGCCGPMGCGPGCGTDHCYDCDGVGTQTIAQRPIDHFRDFRRNLVCGSGCGETYYGEWISTPPDCNDPCCGDQFVGGAVAARPFCWQPGALLGGFCNLYGGRYCSSCGDSYDSCSCGGEVIDGGYVEEPVSGCGCAACSQNESSTRMAVDQRTQSRTARRTTRTRTR